MGKQDYEVIAGALRTARRAAGQSGSVDAVAGVDRAIAEVGRSLASYHSARYHKGIYPWNQARWEEATEYGCHYYTVTDTEDGTPVGSQQPTLGMFKSEDEASAFIGTLPDYWSGRYALDGPAE